MHQGRGAVGKTAVAGLKDRPTNQVKATVVERTDGPTLDQMTAMVAGADLAQNRYEICRENRLTAIAGLCIISVYFKHTTETAK